MTKRYTVSVSDELAEKIEKFKHVISLSNVFQDAMERRVLQEQKFKNQVQEDNMEAIIERLKAEKAETEQDFLNDGREYGIAVAKKLHYATLKNIVDSIPHNYESNWDPADILLNEDKVGGLAENLKEDLQEFESDGYILLHPNGGATESGEAYLRGIIDGIQDFWSEIESKI